MRIGYNITLITLTTTQVQEEIKQSKKLKKLTRSGQIKHQALNTLAFLTNMLKSALNTNIIPHIWKLANIVPIPKPNKDIDKGTSYRPISILSVISKTLEKSILPYITANTPTQRGYKHNTLQ